MVSARKSRTDGNFLERMQYIFLLYMQKKSKLEQQADYKTDLYILFYSDFIVKSKIAVCLRNCPLHLEDDVQFSTFQSPRARYRFKDRVPFAAPVTGAQSPLQQRVEASVHYKSYGAFKLSDEKNMYRCVSWHSTAFSPCQGVCSCNGDSCV